CFDTAREVGAAQAAKPAHQSGSALGDCGGGSVSVVLFSETNWTGDALYLAATSSWDNLSSFGFDNRMKSWANQKSCNETLADGTNGAGDRLVLGAGQWSLDAGTWKNKASSAFVSF